MVRRLGGKFITTKRSKNYSVLAKGFSCDRQECETIDGRRAWRARSILALRWVLLLPQITWLFAKSVQHQLAFADGNHRL